MIRPLALLALLALAAVLPLLPLPAAARESAATVTTSAQGLRLSIGIPHRDYPQNALARVTVTLRNVSHHVIRLSGNNPPSAAVFDATGQLAYDPLEPFGASSFVILTGGPRRAAIPLPPGRHITTELLVVLLGNTLRAFAHLANSHTLATGPLQLTLTTPDSPALTITTSPSPAATIQPRASLPGSPLFIEETSCTAHGGQSSTGRGWLRADRLTLTPVFPPDCQGGRRWQSIAGWIGHSVARIIYPPPG